MSIELGALTSYLGVDSQEYMAPGNRKQTVSHCEMENEDWECSLVDQMLV